MNLEQKVNVLLQEQGMTMQILLWMLGEEEKEENHHFWRQRYIGMLETLLREHPKSS